MIDPWLPCFRLLPSPQSILSGCARSQPVLRQSAGSSAMGWGKAYGKSGKSMGAAWRWLESLPDFQIFGVLKHVSNIFGV